MYITFLFSNWIITESYRMYWKSKGSTSWASGISRFITGVNVNIAPKPIPYNLHLWQMCSSKVLQTQDGERCRLFYVDELTMDIQLWRQWNHCVGDKIVGQTKMADICFGLMSTSVKFSKLHTLITAGFFLKKLSCQFLIQNVQIL